MTTAVTSDELAVKIGYGEELLSDKRSALCSIWIVTFLLVAGVAAFSFMQLQSIKTVQLAVFQSTIGNLARGNEEHALRTMRAADQTLLFVIEQYAIKQDQLDLAGMVASGVIDGSLFLKAGIIDAKGILAFSNVPFENGLDLSDRPNFKVHRFTDSKAMHVSKAVLGHASGKSSIELTRRINSPDGSFGGVAVLSVDVAYFSNFYAELSLPINSMAALVGSDGEIRARQSGDEASTGQNVSQAPFFKRIISGQNLDLDTSTSIVDGVERTYTYRHVHGYPLIVIIGFSTGSLKALYSRARNLLTLQAVGICMLLLAIGTLASFYVLRMQKELKKRNQIAVQLRASETRLELALLGGELGAWEWDLGQTRFTTNNQIFSVLGYREDELSFNKELLVSVISSEDIDEFFHALRLHLRGNSERFKNESRYQHKDGRWIWISITSRVIEWDGQGRALRLSGTAQDVTLRVESSQALARSEERWNLAVSGSNEGIWDWTVDDRSIYLSGRLLTLLGNEGPVEGVTVENWTPEIHPDDVLIGRELLSRHFKGHTDFFRMELRALCQDGSYKWMLVRGRALRNKLGRAFRMTGSLSDISHQHAAREQIQDQNERLNAIFSLSPDALVSFDKTYRVNYTNPAFERLTGFAAAGVVGLAEAELTEKINSQCAPTRLFTGLAALRQLPGAAASKKYGLIELIVPVRRVLQAKLQTSGSISSPQILYLRDVTHETIVEEMKSEFLSTAAHELRTPMASILGFSEVLLTQQLDAAQNKEFLNIIHTQSQQMSSILDELLDLARIEARQDKDFVFETLNLPLLVNEVVKGFSLPLGRLAPVVVIPDANCRADRGKARQVILNVVSNAYKYSPVEGEVTINFVKLHHKDKGLLCGISIQDQGCGMTSEQLDWVFERFYRADASGTTPGTGLGMSIAKEIMEIHGGEILVESVFGVGTSVTLLFPCTNPQDLQGPGDGPDRLCQNETVLSAGAPHA